MTAKTYYHILNISPRASDDDVRTAYRALALKWHPDRHPQNRRKAAQMFVIINRAYTMLKTKPQRMAYNRLLLAQRTPPAPKAPSAAARFFAALYEIFWPFTSSREKISHG